MDYEYYDMENSEMFVFKDVKDLDNFLKKINIQIYCHEEVFDRLIIEGYSSVFNNYIVCNNMKINVQISYFDNMVFLGVPFIESSF